MRKLLFKNNYLLILISIFLLTSCVKSKKEIFDSYSTEFLKENELYVENCLSNYSVNTSHFEKVFPICIDEQKKSHIIETANDNMRLALDILNFTFYDNKKRREWLVMDADNCIFYNRKFEWIDKLYLNNVLPSSMYITRNWSSEEEYFMGKWKTIIKDDLLLILRGNETVFLPYNTITNESGFPRVTYQIVLATNDWEGKEQRLEKAWQLMYSKVCKGVDIGEF